MAWFRNKQRRDQDGHAERIASLEKENLRLIESLDSFENRFRKMARAVWRVEEDERRRLARELHDNLGQVLTALRLRLEAMPESEGRDAALETASHALEDVRNLSRLLRPPVLDDLGLMPALEWLARRMREDAGLPVRVSGEAGGEIDDDVETLLFRIAQEALTNTAKYAEATRAEISLTRAGDRLEIRIRDNGKGFDTDLLGSEERPIGVGIAGMRDRVSFFGGDIAISSALEAGTVVTATVPVKVKEG